MPKDTFFHLPEEKKKRIMIATFELLEENRYADVSINMIIKRAGIPRGSFYQYFEDKDDLVRYMFSDIRRAMGTTVAESLRRQENLTDAAVDILESIARNMENDTAVKVIGNTITDANLFESFMLDMSEDENILVSELKKYIPTSELRLSTEYEKEQLIHLGLGMFEYTAGEMFRNMERKQQIIEAFKVRADIIAYGAVKDRGER